MVAGGSAPNVVPDRCEVEIDRRIVPGEEDPEEVLAPFRRLVDDLVAERPDTHIEITLREWTEAAETTGDSAIAALVRDAIAAETGAPPPFVGLHRDHRRPLLHQRREDPDRDRRTGVAVPRPHRERVDRGRRDGLGGARVRADVRRVPRGRARSGPMDSVDVFVIGGGGTGSEVAFSLARSSGLTVALAERDKLGGECNHYGCVPTKVMLRSAKIATLARDGERFGLRIPEVDVDFPAVQQRARDVIDAAVRRGRRAVRAGRACACSCRRPGSSGERRVELADGSVIEADQRGARDRHGGRRPPDPRDRRTARSGRTARRSGSRTPAPSRSR